METVHISTGTDTDIDGILMPPRAAAVSHGGALFLHGWGSQKEALLVPAQRLTELGFECLTIDLRGHGRTRDEIDRVSAADNLRDALAAYDFLAARPHVDGGAIMLAGFSYGGFLAILLCDRRPVRWLALRSPALYRDEDLQIPKARTTRQGLMRFRRSVLLPNQSLALRAALGVRGDVLVIEAGRDRLVPPQQIRNYLNAFLSARSLTHVVIRDADHALSRAPWRQTAIDTLTGWIQQKSEVGSRAVGSRSQESEVEVGSRSR